MIYHFQYKIALIKNTPVYLSGIILFIQIFPVNIIWHIWLYLNQANLILIGQIVKTFTDKNVSPHISDIKYKYII